MGPEKSGLVFPVAPINGLDVFENQGMNALPAPLSEAHAMRRKPAFFDGGTDGVGEDRLRIVPVGLIDGRLSEVSHVVDELRSVLQIAGFETRKL